MAYLNDVTKQKAVTNVFGGVNRRKRIGDGEWGDAENLSTREYPTATVREKRVIRSLRVTAGSTELPSATNEGQALDVVQSDGLVYLAFYDQENGGAVLVGSDTVPTAGKPEQIVSFGRGAFTQDGTFISYGDDGTQAENVALEIRESGHFELAAAEVNVKPGAKTYFEVSPEDVGDTSEEGDYRFDPWTNTLMMCTEKADGATPAKWEDVPTSRIKILLDASTGDPTAGLHVGDGIHVYEPTQGMDSDFVITNIGPETRKYVVGADVVSVDYQVITVTGTQKFRENSQDYVITVKRRMPVLDYICQWRNRIWGCRYGENDVGDFVNEICCSALGNPMNFFGLEGAADDPYSASVGTGGAWTGIAAAEESVYFFKEDRIFVLTGTAPANFQLREIVGPGIAPGQQKSVIVTDGTIYYKATRGFMRISGYSYAVSISTQIDEILCGPLVGLRDGHLLRWVGEDGMYVLDLLTGAWMMESRIMTKAGTIDSETEEMVTWETAAPAPVAGVQIDGFPVLFVRTPLTSDGFAAETLEAVCFGAQEISTEGFPNFNGSAYGISFSWKKSTEDAVAWQAVTGLRGLADVELKRLRSLQIRVVTEGECSVKAWIEYDLDGTWVPIANEKRQKKGTFLIRHENSCQCDFYRLKFEGVGDVTIYDIAEELEYGGEFAR